MTASATTLASDEPRPTWRRLVKPIATVAIALGLGFGLSRLLRTFDYDDVVLGLSAVPPLRIALAVAVLVASYGLYVVRERIAVNFAGHSTLSTPHVAVATLISRSLSTLGLATVTGFALRLRIYAGYGLDSGAVGRVTVYNESTYYVGLVAAFAMVLSLGQLPPMTSGHWHLPPVQWIGAAAAAVIIGYVVWSVRRTRSLHIRSFELPPMSRGQLAAQLTLPVIDTFFGGLITWMLLPAGAGLSWFGMVTIYLLAGVVGAVSQVPGGLGVFETSVLAFVPPAAHPATLAALLVRRAIVNLLPIAVGTVMLIGFSFTGQVRRRPNRVATEFARDALAIATFAASVLSLIAAAVPRHNGLTERVGPVAQAVVFAAGVATLIASRGLQLGRHRSWALCVALFALRTVAAIASGPHVPSLVVAATMLVLLLVARHAFAGEGGAFDIDRSWFVAWLVALIGITWVADAHPDSMGTEVRARTAGIIVVAAIVVGVVMRRALPAAVRRRRRRG
jgi:phosphatidylglycerol lysyltransferase